MQNVVLVCRHNQTVNRQPHLLGDVACKDVAKVACWHGKADLAVRCADGHSRRKVVHHLCQNPRPVYRIDPRQTHAIAEFKVVEHVLEAGLAIVEITVHRQRVHVGFSWCGHLTALHFGNAAMRVQDEHVDIVEAAECFDRRGTSVAGRRAHNRDPFAATAQCGLKQLTDQLHGKIFERQSRAVEQFEQEMPLIQLYQRRAGGVAEPCVGARDDLFEFRVREHVANKGAHDCERDVLVRLASHACDLVCTERRDRFRHIQPAITSETGQHCVFECQRGGLAAGGDVFHVKYLCFVW